MKNIFVGIGSNLRQPVEQVQHAMVRLKQCASLHWISGSSLYQSRPLAALPQPDYINAVVQLHTSLSPHALLDALQAIETTMGRRRGVERWASRVIDLDILLYGESIIEDSLLTIPHIGLEQREFWLYPLFEIAPQLRLPRGSLLRDMLAVCSTRGLVRVDNQSIVSLQDRNSVYE